MIRMAWVRIGAAPAVARIPTRKIGAWWYFADRGSCAQARHFVRKS